MPYHEAWAIVNMTSKNAIVFGEKFQIFSDEGAAWEECIRLRGLNPTHELSVRKTKVPLYWK